VVCMLLAGLFTDEHKAWRQHVFTLLCYGGQGGLQFLGWHSCTVNKAAELHLAELMPRMRVTCS
jgi:hypothetical protein